MKKLKLVYVLFDVIGTTVRDHRNGESLVLECFVKSFQLSGYQIGHDRINRQRGKSKREAIRDLLTEFHYNSDLTEKVFSDFIELLKESLHCFSEIQGASELFEHLHNKDIKIGLGSGLPKEFLNGIIRQVGWNTELFDYIGSSDELGKGRPDPIMIFDSMKKLNISDRSSVLKIGDTVADIQEGKNAGVKTAGVLTGTQEKDELVKQQPDLLFSDINELKKLI